MTTSIVNRYFTAVVLAVVCCTGLDYMLKDTEYNGKKIKLQLWWVFIWSYMYWIIKHKLRLLVYTLILPVRVDWSVLILVHNMTLAPWAPQALQVKHLFPCQILFITYRSLTVIGWILETLRSQCWSWNQVYSNVIWCLQCSAGASVILWTMLYGCNQYCRHV